MTHGWRSRKRQSFMCYMFIGSLYRWDICARSAARYQIAAKNGDSSPRLPACQTTLVPLPNLELSLTAGIVSIAGVAMPAARPKTRLLQGAGFEPEAAHM